MRNPTLIRFKLGPTFHSDLSFSADLFILLNTASSALNAAIKFRSFLGALFILANLGLIGYLGFFHEFHGDLISNIIFVLEHIVIVATISGVLIVLLDEPSLSLISSKLRQSPSAIHFPNWIISFKDTLDGNKFTNFTITGVIVNKNFPVEHIHKVEQTLEGGRLRVTLIFEKNHVIGPVVEIIKRNISVDTDLVVTFEDKTFHFNLIDKVK